MKEKINRLSHLLMDFESKIGTTHLFYVLFDALRDAVDDFEPKTNKDLRKQFEDLVNAFCNTKPRFGILNYYFQEMVLKFRELPEDTDLKKFLKEEFIRVEKQERDYKQQILEFANTIETKGKNILFHDQSHLLRDVLDYLWTKNHDFEVLLVEQEKEKTHSNIEFLHEKGIPFHVVPDYVISHMTSDVDMCFWATLTLQDTMNFIMSPGSMGVVSSFHAEKVPQYMFLQTTKFSLWKSAPREDIFHKKEKRKHHKKQIEYDRLKFSHDRVPLFLFDHIVTEKGVQTPEDVKKEFKGLMKD